MMEGYHYAISPQSLCQVKSSLDKRMNQNLAFPTQVYELTQLSFDYESLRSATLLLTDFSLSTAIKAFVFHTIPQSHLLRRDDGGPFENNEAA